ncbi:MAG: hypothetical protein RL226_1474 [Bacteroidota bacterium]|jgi:outer membrane protein OmpA-like peptidoglycan-associated protein
MNKSLLLALSLAIAAPAFSQDDELNLVPNGDFEQANTKTLKNPGMLQELCEGWYTATKAPADLFAEGVKSEKVAVPVNQFGKESAASGNLYAGFTAYTTDKKATRSYLAVQLSQPLEKDQMYCVEFKISLADLSKFGVNYVGALISDRKIVQPNTGAIIKDVNDITIKDRSNKAMINMDGWETVCGTVVGGGREQYLIIGCFGADKDLTIEKTKKPKEVVGTPFYSAYYFVDDVKITAVEAKSQCSCTPEADRAPDLIYGQASVVDENTPADQLVNMSAVYYAALKKSYTQAGQQSIDQVIDILKKNPSWKVEVAGHCDNDEFDEAKINTRYRALGEQRAKEVADYMIANGIAQDRITIVSKENNEPANTRPTDMSRAQNRRVTFKVKK